MQAKSEQLGTMPMGKLIAKMSIPLMVSMLIQSMYNIVDSIFVSRLGMEAISAIGIAFPIQMLMIALANGLGVGMNALISQRFGRKESEKVGRAAGNDILLSASFMLGFMLFGLLGCEAYFRASNSNELIIAYGIQYLQTVSIGCVGLFYVILAERLLQVTGNTTLSMLTQLSGAIINIIFDPILIFGLFGFPEMGIQGAALATIAGQIIAAILGFCLHWKVNHELKIKLSDIRMNADALEICRVGLPVTITMSMSSIMIFAMNKMLAPFVEALSVFTVYYRLQSFFFMPTAGMVQGLIPIIGFNFGAKNGERLRKAIRLAALAALCIMIIGLLVCQLFPGWIIGLFDDGKNVGMVVIGVRAIRIISWVFPFAGVAMVCSNLFQGMGNGIPGMVYGLSRQCVIFLPAAWLILHAYGVTFIWYAFWIAELCTAVIIALVFRVEYRKRVMPLLKN
jgi:putative MATE family efflux protein